MVPLKKGNFETWIDLNDALQNLIMIILTLNELCHLSNPQLKEDIVSKLPCTLKLQWAQLEAIFENCRGKTNLEDLAVWLDEIADAAARMVSPKFGKSVEINQPRWHGFPRQTVMITTSNESAVKHFCTKDHILTKCRSFLKEKVNDRWKFVMSKKLCFICLGTRHAINGCKKKAKWGIEDCQKFHHKVLRTGSKQDTSQTHGILQKRAHGQCEEKSFEKEVASVSIHCLFKSFQVFSSLFISSLKKILLRVIPVDLRGTRKTIKTFALLDASTVTLIDAAVAAEIGVAGLTDSLKIQWTNDVIHEEKKSQRVSLKVGNVSGSEMFHISNVRTFENLSLL